MNGRRAYHTTCGFSFVELLTATAVGAVLLTLAVPQLPVFWAQFQLGNSARQVAITLQRARMRAVGENGFYRVVFAADNTYVLQSSVDGSSFANAEQPLVLPDGIGFLGTLPQPTFNRLGTVGSDAQVVVVNSLGQVKTVAINILGKISIS